MKERTKKPQISKAWLAAVIALVLVAGLWAFMRPAVKVAGAPTSRPTPSPKVTPSATPSNLGDQAKSQLSAATPTPTPKSAANAGARSIAVSNFAVTPQGNGVIRIQDDELTGATSGTCTLALASPQGNQNQTVTGNIAFSGTYYFCSFGTISSVSDSGAWKAALSAASGTSTSNTEDTVFSIPGK